MKNPLDRFAFIEMGILASITLSAAIIILSIIGNFQNGNRDSILTIGVIACLSFSCFIVVLTIITQLIVRPTEVNIERELIIHWRFKDPMIMPLDSISDLVISPKGPHSMKTRWTGGAVGLKGKWIRFGVKYEIAITIRDKYFDLYGRYPPFPTGYK
jgi:hypothetical protein